MQDVLKSTSITRSQQATAGPGFRYVRILIAFLAITTLILPIVTNPNAAIAADSLGLRIEVLPGTSSAETEPYAQNRRLWLVTSSATPVTRTIRISSTVDNAQLITLYVAGAKQVGKDSKLDSSRESELKPWVSFSNNEFQLPAKGQIDVEVMVTPPADLMDYSQNAFLVVKAAATSATEVDATTTTANLSSQFQYATPMFFGVGEIENLISLQIKDVNTYIDEVGKYAEIEILNNGVSPIEIDGDIQFTNLDFQTANIGPLDFTIPPLAPGEMGLGTVRLPDTAVAGKYKMFIQANVGSYGEALIITKDLSFEIKKPSQVTRYIVFGVSFLALLLLIWYRRRILSNSTQDVTAPIEPKIKAAKVPKIKAVKPPRIKAVTVEPATVKPVKQPKPVKIPREPKLIEKQERVPLITVRSRKPTTSNVKSVEEASEALDEAKRRVAEMMESLTSKR
jgi:hypothetical protein